MQPIPTRQSAIQFVGPDEFVLVHDKPVDDVGPTQLLLRVEACGICFSDTKLLHAFGGHPRKSDVLSGLSATELESVPSYRPGGAPTVPGHEPVGRVVRVGERVARFSVGDRVLVQADWRHLPTAESNSAFGYNFEGALQEYVLLDERIVAPAGGDELLLGVSEEPSAAGVGLVEPWSTVEAAYGTVERTTVRPGGEVLVVIDAGAAPAGLAELFESAHPATVTVLGGGDGLLPDAVGVRSLEDVVHGTFDDILYFGSNPEVVEQVAGLLAAHGLLCVALCGGRLGRRVSLDVGRIHYDGVRYVGTTSDAPQEAYTRIPSTSEIRPHDQVLIVGAAGPMGLMHTMRTIALGLPGLDVTAADVNDDRLATLASVVGPTADREGVPIRIVNSASVPLGAGYTHLVCLVPAPAPLVDVVDRAGRGAIVNAFAGFPAGTCAGLDLQGMIERGVYMLGSSGSDMTAMRKVLRKLEAGALDTNVSLDAITGLEGFAEAIESVRNRTSGGKIMVYPQLRDLPLTRLAELAVTRPEVAAKLDHGVWCRAAEDELLADVRAGEASR